MDNYFSYWSRKLNRGAESPFSRLHNKRYVPVPGHQGDLTDHGQPKRFEKWYKLPRAAHRLFWRFHP